jgi:hypothetical protein
MASSVLSTSWSGGRWWPGSLRWRLRGPPGRRPSSGGPWRRDRSACRTGKASGSSCRARRRPPAPSRPGRPTSTRYRRCTCRRTDTRAHGSTGDTCRVCRVSTRRRRRTAPPDPSCRGRPCRGPRAPPWTSCSGSPRAARADRRTCHSLRARRRRLRCSRCRRRRRPRGSGRKPRRWCGSARCPSVPTGPDPLVCRECTPRWSADRGHRMQMAGVLRIRTSSP